MLTNIQSIRQIAYEFKKSLFERPPKPKRLPVIDGIPESLDLELLNRVCLEQCDGAVKTVSHQHLSGWKESGAYRLLIKNTRGKEIKLIFKEAFYGENVIPALADLPVRPGPPEFAVLSQPFGALATFLPQVYLAEERIPGIHYRYIVEDLAKKYHYAAGDRAALQAAKVLPKLHLALNDWAQSANTQSFITYGIDFSTALQQYALSKLTAYQQEMPDPILQKVLDIWPEIASLHLHPEFFATDNNCPVHGDTNFTNIYIHNEDPQKIKVVDWEWAGFNNPFSDLVSLLKGTTYLVERRGVIAFAHFMATQNKTGKQNQMIRQYHRLYTWSKMERGMLDAAFLSAQLLNTNSHGKVNMSNAAIRALQRILTTYHQLTH
jgi:thiamine kinase-like enzyme